MRPFRDYFTTAVWRHSLVLVAGSLLAPGRRTVTTALRVLGLKQASHHRVLSHGRGLPVLSGSRLLLLLVAAIVPMGPPTDRAFARSVTFRTGSMTLPSMVVGIDDRAMVETG